MSGSRPTPHRARCDILLVSLVYSHQRRCPASSWRRRKGAVSRPAIEHCPIVLVPAGYRTASRCRRFDSRYGVGHSLPHSARPRAKPLPLGRDWRRHPPALKPGSRFKRGDRSCFAGAPSSLPTDVAAPRSRRGRPWNRKAMHVLLRTNANEDLLRNIPLAVIEGLWIDGTGSRSTTSVVRCIASIPRFRA